MKKKTKFATTTTRKELERTRKLESEIKLTREEELIIAWLKQHAPEIRRYIKEVEATSQLG